MSSHRRCFYCGWPRAIVRKPGEPATCHGCRDLPGADRRRELEAERELDRYYNGEQSTRT